MCLCTLICLFVSFEAGAQVSADVEKAEKKLEKAREDFEKAQKAVDEELARLKKEAESNPKAHGPAPELEKRREALKKAKEYLEKSREALKKALEKSADKAEKVLKREKAKRTPDPQKCAEAENALKEAQEKLKKMEEASAALPKTDTGRPPVQRCFLIGAAAMLSSPAIRHVDATAIQAAATNPADAEHLIETLGGLYFIGNVSGNKPESGYPMNSRVQIIPGLRAGIGLGRTFELKGNILYYNASWKGNFPVTVIPFEAAPPHTVQGSMEARVTGLLAESGMVWLPLRGRLSPYAAAGVRSFFRLASDSRVRLSGIEIPIDAGFQPVRFSAFAEAGLRVVFFRNGFVETGFSIGKTAENASRTAFTCGIGWKFGAGRP